MRVTKTRQLGRYVYHLKAWLSLLTPIIAHRPGPKNHMLTIELDNTIDKQKLTKTKTQYFSTICYELIYLVLTAPPTTAVMVGERLFAMVDLKKHPTTPY